MIKVRQSSSNVTNAAEFSAHLACKRDITSGVEPLGPGLYLIKKRKRDEGKRYLGTECAMRVEDSTQNALVHYLRSLGENHAVSVEVTTQIVTLAQIWPRRKSARAVCRDTWLNQCDVMLTVLQRSLKRSHPRHSPI